MAGAAARDGSVTPWAATAAGVHQATRCATVHCVGVSFRTAPLAIRERLAGDASAHAAALARFGCGHESRPPGVSELVVLSTCNRVELYAAGSIEGTDVLPSLMADVTGVPIDEIEPALYLRSGEDAVRHLSRVAAGLESLAIGEPQILGQVADALALSMTHSASGPVLSAVFRGAIRAGRRARAETGIARSPVSVSTLAAAAVASLVPDLSRSTLLVIGAGEMASLAASALTRRGARDIVVMSRTLESAEELAGRFEGRATTFERLSDALVEADVIVTSTTAPHHVIGAELAATIMARRPDRPLVIVDIAVPRDVEPGAGDIPNVTLIDLDSLQSHVDSNVAVRESEIPAVEAIVEEEAVAAMAWLRQLEIAPLIAELRAHTEGIRRQVLDRAARHFAHLSGEDRRRLEWFSASLVNAVLHEPTTRLKDETAGGESARFALALRRLFGLEE